MRFLMLKVAYDGSNYHGFQRQKNAIAVQDILENALKKILKEDINLAASGRTDTGVHAKGQVVSFATNGKIPTERIVPALKSFLPQDILVWQAKETSSDFNARFSAIKKLYRYRILLDSHVDPFERNYAWTINNNLNLSLMKQASELLIGEHDFSAFKSAGSVSKTPIKTIYRAQWKRVNDKELEFFIEGNGFLYHMVRNIVGCLVRVGEEKITVDNFREIFESKTRKKAGMAAPPQGLYLEHVTYKNEKKVDKTMNNG